MADETLLEEFRKMETSLLELARSTCSNTFSNSCQYILTDFQEIEHENVFEQRRLRNTVNASKARLSIEDAANYLISIYQDLHDIIFYVYKSESKITTIEIQYFRTSALGEEGNNLISKSEPMQHCKVSIPPYVELDSNEKFNVNWELGGLYQSWRMFKWRVALKMKLYFR